MPTNKRSVYDLNAMLPDPLYFEIFFDLDHGHVQALTSLRYQTLKRQGKVAPKEFTGSLMDYAKSVTMKRIFLENERSVVAWHELIDRSFEFARAGDTFKEGDV